jgi:hypothetical protein
MVTAHCARPDLEGDQSAQMRSDHRHQISRHGTKPHQNQTRGGKTSPPKRMIIPQQSPEKSSYAVQPTPTRKSLVTSPFKSKAVNRWLLNIKSRAQPRVAHVREDSRLIGCTLPHVASVREGKPTRPRSAARGIEHSRSAARGIMFALCRTWHSQMLKRPTGQPINILKVAAAPGKLGGVVRYQMLRRAVDGSPPAAGACELAVR